MSCSPSAGQYGFLGMAIPEQYGGGGTHDFRFNAVIAEEFAPAGSAVPGLGVTLHNDICTPYFLEYCNDEQAQRWLPGIASGELITAIAMTEPGTGSDLAGIATTAVRDGDEYVVNGSKTFITNGINSDLVIVAAKTDPTAAPHRHVAAGDRARHGRFRTRAQPREDRHAQPGHRRAVLQRRPRARRQPARRRGQGFPLPQPQPRPGTPVDRRHRRRRGRAALGWTLDYVGERTAFGKSIGSFQNTKFVLAEVETEVDVAQAYVDQCVLAPQRRRARRRRSGPGQVLVHRPPEARRSTAACSCSAATAT